MHMRAPTASCGRRFYYDNDGLRRKGLSHEARTCTDRYALGDIEGICGRIEDQARLAHERGARVLCVPAPLFMGALPGGLVGAADFEHDMLTGLTGVAERIQELDMICIVPAAVSFEGQPLLDYMMLKDGHVVPARSSIALQRGGNGDARWAPPVFDVDGVRIAVIFDLDRELEMLPTGVDLIAYFQFNAFDMTAHRIGQQHTVTVYKLIAKDTIEERIMQMQESKRDLVNSVLGGDGISSVLFSREDVLALLGGDGR